MQLILLFLLKTIYEVVDPDRIELLPQFATPDPFVYQIGVALKSALAKHGSSSRLYAESLINTLIIHLLEHYSTERLKFVWKCSRNTTTI